MTTVHTQQYQSKWGRVYLDHNATSKLHPVVLETMLPYWQAEGNAASIHRHGRWMRQAVETAREQVAALTGAHPSEVIFTAGGTEANNLAVKGFALSQITPAALLVGSMEHDSVLKSAHSLSALGWKVAELAANTQGQYTLETLKMALDNQAYAFCSLMLANNETGVLQDIAALADIAHHYDVMFHTDAVQAIGKVDLNFQVLGVDLMTLSAHKMGGPIGVGALLKKPQVALKSLLDGGAHEQGLRAGTENVPLIVGFGKMCELAKEQRESRLAAFKSKQHRLETQLNTLAGVKILAQDAPRLPNTTLLAVEHIDGEMLIMALDKKGISTASGSACGNLAAGGSHVIQAMQVPEPWASNTIRISVGWNTTNEECDAFIHALQEVMAESKQLSWG